MTDVPPIHISTLGLPLLSELLSQLKEKEARVKAEIQLVNDEIANRVSNEAAALFQAQEKTSGDVTFVVDGIKLKASVSKTVKWDDEKLKAIASDMPWEIAHRVFDISFKVPEATFKAIPDPELVARLTEARTVKYGEMTIKPI